jgi:hypothetical protein
MDWDAKSDQEIMDQLHTAQLADRLEQSEEWKIVHEAMKRIYDKHSVLLRKADPQDSNALIQLQQICNMYAEDFLPQLIKNFQNIGEFSFQEAKRRNLLEQFFKRFR